MSKATLINNVSKRDAKQLKRLQGLPLEQKVNLSLRSIRDFINKCGGNTYVSFSGGKDSTILLDLVRQIDPNIKAVLSDTGLEFPEIKEFVKTVENVEWVYPKMNFKQVIERYGYPLAGGKRYRSRARIALKGRPIDGDRFEVVALCLGLELNLRRGVGDLHGVFVSLRVEAGTQGTRIAESNT